MMGTMKSKGAFPKTEAARSGRQRACGGKKGSKWPRSRVEVAGLRRARDLMDAEVPGMAWSEIKSAESTCAKDLRDMQEPICIESTMGGEDTKSRQAKPTGDTTELTR